MDRVQSSGKIGKVNSFRDLQVWQKAHNLALSIYRETMAFPKEELYGLTSQIRRASVSTAANIVEGSKRKSKRDFAHFLNFSQGSNEEVKYFLLLGKDLNYIIQEKYSNLERSADEIGAMLHSFVFKLNSDT